LIVQFQVWHIAMPFEGGDHSIVDLWCTNFGLNGSLLIAKQSCKPSELS